MSSQKMSPLAQLSQALPKWEKMLVELGLVPSTPLLVVEAAAPRWPAVEVGTGLLILEVRDQARATQVKAWLEPVFSKEHQVVLLREEGPAWVALGRLDQLGGWGEGVALYVLPRREEEPVVRPSFKSRHFQAALYPLDPIVGVMQRLRGEGGCPWDKAQTHHTLKPYLVEESYEVWEAIDEQNMDKLCDELGDVLLQIVFHAQLATESQDFDINDVVQAVTAKMIRRHPHVFGEVKVRDAADVVANWEEIKRREEGAGERASILDGVPRDLPSLAVAQKIQARAARVGFDWERLEDVVRKVWEEAREVRDAYRRLGEKKDEEAQRRLEGEFGDLLFAVVNVARFLGVNAEAALRRAVDKFEKRFRYIEALATAQGRQLAEMTLAEMDELWEKAKLEVGG